MDTYNCWCTGSHKKSPTSNGRTWRPAGWIENPCGGDTASAGSGFRTRTVTDPAAATSVLGMAAVTRVGLTNVVGRGWSFHRTTAPGTNAVPSTVSVKFACPADE